MAKRLLALGFLALIAPAPPVHAQIYKDPATEAQSMGTVENGVYHHNLTGIEFTLPPAWVILSQGWVIGRVRVPVR
jgi:hypothetical protein